MNCCYRGIGSTEVFREHQFDVKSELSGICPTGFCILQHAFSGTGLPLLLYADALTFEDSQQGLRALQNFDVSAFCLLDDLVILCPCSYLHVPQLMSRISKHGPGEYYTQD